MQITNFQYKNSYYYANIFKNLFEVCYKNEDIKKHLMPTVNSNGIEFLIEENLLESKVTSFMGMKVAMDSGYILLNQDHVDRNILFLDLLGIFRDCFGQQYSLSDMIYMIELVKTGEFTLSEAEHSPDSITNALKYIEGKKSSQVGSNSSQSSLNIPSVLVAFLKAEVEKTSSTKTATKSLSKSEDDDKLVKDIHALSKLNLDKSLKFQKIMYEVLSILFNFSHIKSNVMSGLKSESEWESYIFPDSSKAEQVNRSFIFKELTNLFRNYGDLNELIKGKIKGTPKIVGTGNKHYFLSDDNRFATSGIKTGVYVDFSGLTEPGRNSKDINNLDFYMMNVVNTFLSSDAIMNKVYDRATHSESAFTNTTILGSTLDFFQNTKEGANYDSKNVVKKGASFEVNWEGSALDNVPTRLESALLLLTLNNKISLDLLDDSKNNSDLIPLLHLINQDIFNKAIFTDESIPDKNKQAAINLMRKMYKSLPITQRYFTPDTNTYVEPMKAKGSSEEEGIANIGVETLQYFNISNSDYTSLDSVRLMNKHYVNVFKILNILFKTTIIPKLK